MAVSRDGRYIESAIIRAPLCPRRSKLSIQRGKLAADAPRSASPSAGVRSPLRAAALVALIIGACLLGIRNPLLARTAMLGGTALVLWLSEVVPTYAVTLGLLAAVPLVLGTFHAEFGLRNVLTWAADPVMILFFGGFALGVAATQYRLDAYLAERALTLSRHSQRRMLAVVMATTAVLSMWMSTSRPPR